MKTLALLVSLLVIPAQLAHAQQFDPLEGAVIESTEVSGLALDRLSPGLRRDIDALVGVPLKGEVVNQLAERIEEERPDVVAAVRSVARPNGEARVIFLVARIGDDQHLASNINARYTVEKVEIAGVPEEKVSQALRDELQALVGKRLDPDEAERLEDRIADELPDYKVDRRTVRGTQPGQIRLVFDVTAVEPPPWIPLAPSRSKVVYHSKQGWSGALDIPMGSRDHRVTLGFVFGDKDDLIEEYSGYRLRFESRKVVTERLGVSVEVAKYHQSWRSETLTALASNPAISDAYRTRVTVEPLVTVGLGPTLRVAGGVSVSELESLPRSPDSLIASSAVGSVIYDQGWTLASGFRQNVQASYILRAATTALDSDFLYRRHLGQAEYELTRGHNNVTVSASVGRITGHAPLFERFTLGDSSTLRGWSKFDIAPAGGDRMFHQSLEYSHRGMAVFLDTGSVWDQATDMRIRLATGFGFHDDNAFLMFGFPLNAKNLSASFMAGIRF